MSMISRLRYNRTSSDKVMRILVVSGTPAGSKDLINLLRAAVPDSAVLRLSADQQAIGSDDPLIDVWESGGECLCCGDDGSASQSVLTIFNLVRPGFLLVDIGAGFHQADAELSIWNKLDELIQPMGKVLITGSGDGDFEALAFHKWLYVYPNVDVASPFLSAKGVTVPELAAMAAARAADVQTREQENVQLFCFRPLRCPPIPELVHILRSLVEGHYGVIEEGTAVLENDGQWMVIRIVGQRFTLSGARIPETPYISLRGRDLLREDLNALFALAPELNRSKKLFVDEARAPVLDPVAANAETRASGS
jgi:hypothetical protein